MSRESDTKIARWLGYTDYDGAYAHKHPVYGWCELLCYSTKDAVAVTLLPVLFERGYGWDLRTDMMNNTYQFILTPPSKHYPNENSVCSEAPTIAAAISSAVLELIEKDGKE